MILLEWVDTILIFFSGYVLTKREFWDGVNLKYNWLLSCMPSKCVCEANVDLSYAFTCKKGGFLIIRQNEIRNITTNLLNEVCKDVCVEPLLTPLSGESIIPKWSNTSAEARLDISVRGVWITGQQAFFDVRVFNPFARRYSGLTLSQAYRPNENEKKRMYSDPIMNVEHGTCTPLVFLCFWRNGSRMPLILQTVVLFDIDSSERDLFCGNCLG